jgi:hypothetical protein
MLGARRQTRDHASSIFARTLVVSFCVPMAAYLSNPLGKIHCCIHYQINIAKQIIKLLLLGRNKQTNQQQESALNYALLLCLQLTKTSMKPASQCEFLCMAHDDDYDKSFATHHSL